MQRESKFARPLMLLTCMTALLLADLFLTPPRASAQDFNPRIGVGADAVINPFGRRLSGQIFGLGLRGRASLPINQDVSVLGGLGFTGFFLDGTQDATYLMNPEVGLVVTLPIRDWAPYIIGGLGGYILIGGPQGREGGPAIHGGMGWVRPLAETSIYVEVNPALVLYERGSVLIVPFRVGIIL